MNFFDFLSLIGGLALFLYGMELMGEGLSMVAGGKLQKILSSLTDSKVKSVLLGAGVTAIIQSSSATTVMVVGLVNSGIIELKQAVGVIMGANVGTTVTSWILSLAGIESTNFWIKMLKPSSFSPVIAIVGVGLLLFSKREKKRNIGKLMIGFAVLMYGMDSMSSSLNPLSEMKEFKNLFITFENPVLGLLVGMILTSIIQSSSASVGILQALSMTRLVTFASAIPIIMGQNIGTCVTAIISSIGVEKNGKRAALIHLYFNIIGTVVFMTVFYVLHFMVNFDFMKETILPINIATIHSIFNISTTLMLLPFSKYLIKLSVISIPEKHDEMMEEKKKIHENIKLLDEIFLENPHFAMTQCRQVADFMANLAKKSVKRASKCIFDYSDELYEHISEVEYNIDTYEDAISTYLVKLSSSDNISHKDSRYVTTLLKLVGYFERIGDHAFNIAQNTKIMKEKNLSISDEGYGELEVYLNAIDEVVDKAIECYTKEDIRLAHQVEPLEDVIDDLTQLMKNRHIQRLVDCSCSVEVGIIWSDIIADFERISDHCSNIAILIINMHTKNMDMHQYIHSVKKKDNPVFVSMYNDYREKYYI